MPRAIASARLWRKCRAQAIRGIAEHRTRRGKWRFSLLPLAGHANRPPEKDSGLMLKLLARRVLAAVGLSLVLGAPTEALAPNVARPALWEISDPDTTIYLFGTIHLLPDNLQWRTAKFDQAVASAQQLVVETIVDEQEFAEHPWRPMFKLGFRQGLPPIAQRVPAAKRSAACARRSRRAGFRKKCSTRWRPGSPRSCSWPSIQGHGPQRLARPRRNPARAISRQPGSRSASLRAISNSSAISTSLPEKAQRELLEGAIEPPKGMHEEFGEMLAGWSKGDVKQIAATFNRDLAHRPSSSRR